MTAPLPFYRKIGEAGFFTIVEVDIEPGRTAQVPVRTALLGKPEGDAMIRAVLARHEETRDQLREGP
jgi:hypothetical protein